MKIPSKIFLIGPMGAGKSTIGKQLASALKLTFEDTDNEIQRRTGVDIPTIFEYEGEEGFRQREAQAIEQLTLRRPGEPALVRDCLIVDAPGFPLRCDGEIGGRAQLRWSSGVWCGMLVVSTPE